MALRSWLVQVMPRLSTSDRRYRAIKLTGNSIVFIHGFTGHPENTWTHYGDNTSQLALDENSENTNQKQSTSPLRKTRQQATTRSSVYWPRDLLPQTLPGARVITYGYDTRIRHAFGSPSATGTVYEIANNLLVALEGERRSAPSRPILFIVHSLGGIVVKEMLRRSYSSRLSQQHLHSICTSTKALIFFGTPHNGADPRGPLLRALEKVVKIVGFSVNEKIVNALLPTSERLKELRDEFVLIAQEFGWVVHSFQEGIGLRILNWSKVVEDTSSCLSCPSIEVTEQILSNHMDMCKFASNTSPEYQKVVRALLRISGSGLNVTSIYSTPGGHYDNVSPEKLIQSLRFEGIGVRKTTIKKQRAGSCEWLLSQSTYIRWLDLDQRNERNGFLWIKGNPGAGKSTLMKFLTSHLQKKSDGKSILSFFFNARGGPLERNIQGLYRSLLLQLIQGNSHLQRLCCSLIESEDELEDLRSLELLKELLESAIVASTGQLTILVDALDECDESKIREMLSFFRRLVKAMATRRLPLFICLSSRHYPHISMPGSLELNLDHEEGHDHDIASYIDSELHIGHGKVADSLRSDLLTKASGIFMWVVLVVRILNQEYDRGHIRALQQKLVEIPGDLNKLFESILEKDMRNRDQLLLCVQFLAVLRRVKSSHLYHAVISTVDSQNFVPFDPEVDTPEVINNFILNATRGLAEVVGREVQFIHQSVHDFFLRANRFAEISPVASSNFHEESYIAVTHCCYTYVERTVEIIHHGLHPDREKLCNYPFIPYTADLIVKNRRHDGDLDLPSSFEGRLKEYLRRPSDVVSIAHLNRSVIASSFCLKELPANPQPIFLPTAEQARSRYQQILSPAMDEALFRHPQTQNDVSVLDYLNNFWV
ncbi:hypothetical protein F5Y04DRAFT_82486 [Hypomontagnella monticulosa]|nr:hypothetical protein F5Y04DRAFT_82486 [Hypomontagnella monticulosa]